MARALRILLILTQALWLNVMLPGHTRGSITLSGTKQSSCCASKNNSKEHAPTQRDREHCAICYFAAGLITPPVVDFRLTELGLAELLPVPPPHEATSADFPLAYHGRAPPVV